MTPLATARIRGWMMLLSLAAIGVLPRTAAAQIHTFTSTHPAGGVPAVDISVGDASVRIQASGQETVEVTGRLAPRLVDDDPDRAARLMDAVMNEPPVVVDGDTVRVGGLSEDAARDISLAYDVRVPAYARVVVRTTSGRVTVDGVAGPLTIRTVAGAAAITGAAGTVDVETDQGAITISRASGDVVAVSRAGSVTARQLSGPFFARTASGRVHATLIGTGDADVETATAPVSVRGAGGRVIVSTGSGAIEVSGAPADEWSVRTMSGDIDARLAPRSAARIDASTGRGSIKLDVPGFQGTADTRLVSGDLNGSGVPVRLLSGSGAIRLAESR
jgi:hypothetical protein